MTFLGQSDIFSRDGIFSHFIIRRIYYPRNARHVPYALFIRYSLLYIICFLYLNLRTLSANSFSRHSHFHCSGFLRLDNRQCSAIINSISTAVKSLCRIVVFGFVLPNSSNSPFSTVNILSALDSTMLFLPSFLPPLFRHFLCRCPCLWLHPSTARRLRNLHPLEAGAPIINGKYLFVVYYRSSSTQHMASYYVRIYINSRALND